MPEVRRCMDHVCPSPSSGGQAHRAPASGLQAGAWPHACLPSPSPDAQSRSRDRAPDAVVGPGLGGGVWAGPAPLGPPRVGRAAPGCTGGPLPDSPGRRRDRDLPAPRPTEAGGPPPGARPVGHGLGGRGSGEAGQRWAPPRARACKALGRARTGASTGLVGRAPAGQCDGCGPAAAGAGAPGGGAVGPTGAALAIGQTRRVRARERGGVSRGATPRWCAALPAGWGQAGVGRGQPCAGEEAAPPPGLAGHRTGRVGRPAPRCPHARRRAQPASAPARGRGTGGRAGGWRRHPWPPQRRSRRTTPSPRHTPGGSPGRGARVAPTASGGTHRGAAQDRRARWAGAIDRGLRSGQAAQAAGRPQRRAVEAIQATRAPASGSCAQRQAQWQAWQAPCPDSADPIRPHLGQGRARCAPGLFVGGEEADLPWDHLALERWLRPPQGPARRRHGHRHAGGRIVPAGPTLLVALEAHVEPPGPFTAED